MDCTLVCHLFDLVCLDALQCCLSSAGNEGEVVVLEGIGVQDRDGQDKQTGLLLACPTGAR